MRIYFFLSKLEEIKDLSVKRKGIDSFEVLVKEKNTLKMINIIYPFAISSYLMPIFLKS